MIRTMTFGAIALFLATLSSCKSQKSEEHQKSSEPGIPAKSDKVDALLAKGGATWNSPAAFKVPGRKEEVRGGDRFWIMPVSDTVTVTGKKRLRLTLYWRVRSGRPKPGSHGEDDILGNFEIEKGGITFTPGRGGWVAAGGAKRADLPTGAESGQFTYDFEMREGAASGEGWIRFFLSGPKHDAPATSNLLRLKVRFE